MNDVDCKNEAGPAWRRLWLCIALIALPSGCRLDDLRLVDDQDGGVSDAATLPGESEQDEALDGDLSVSCATAGEFRCDPTSGRNLQVCDPLAASAWVTVEACESPALCDARQGTCRVCVPGEFWCDSWRLKACNADGTGWNLVEECESPEYCDSRRAQCSTCLVGDAYCSGSTLLSCNSNKDGYVATDCSSPDQCNVASMSCRECVPGEWQCNLAQLLQCSDDATWQVMDECASAALCKSSLELQLTDPARPAACAQPSCEPGQFKCSEADGRNLLGCPPNQGEWSLVSVCATAELCDASAGTCRESVCSPGAHRCSGVALQRCAADGTSWETLETCASADWCNVASRACTACEPGDVQCNGASLQRCGDDLSWETLLTCASADLCLADQQSPGDSRCELPVCSRSEYRCVDEQLELCNAERTGWESVAACGSAALCNAVDGRCDAAGCSPAGSHRCRSNQLEQCAQDQSGWSLVTACEAGEACDLGELGCVTECPERAFRCNGSVPERCESNDDGSIAWVAAAAPCATAGLCSATDDSAACKSPVCGGSLPRFRCDPDDPSKIQRCNENRDGWQEVDTCPDDTTCDVGVDGDGPTQCDVCAATTWSCDNGVLSRCADDGQRRNVLETCLDQEHCVISSDAAQGYCLRCDEGDMQCNADAVDTCAPDRRGWVEQQACDPRFGCHDDAGRNDYCNVCAAPNEANCNQDNLEVCDDAQANIVDVVECELGCQVSPDGSDYCRECQPQWTQCSEDDDNERRTCSTTGLWNEYQVCADDSPCYDAGNADYCGQCTPGSVFCFSATQEQSCAMSGTPGAVTDCPSQRPVCVADIGECVECTPGAPSQCVGDSGSSGRRQCSASGEWVSANCDGATPVCHDGECVECEPSTTRCTSASAASRERCTGGTWQSADCSATNRSECWDGECVECNPTTSAPRCLQSSGPGREVCSDGEWTAASCSSDMVCVDGECLQCDPELQGPQCLADSGASARRVCVDGAWARDDCQSPTPNCDQGACTCENGDSRCTNGGQRQVCQGGSWVDAPCSAGHCDAGECVDCLEDDDCPDDFPECSSEGVCGCELGAERCTSTGAHQVCSGTLWEDVACPDATPACNAQTGACECTSGSTRCSGGVVQECVSGGWQNAAGSPTCTSCSTNAECSGTSPICDGMVCAPCSDDCPSGFVCADSGACVECTTGDTRLCEPEQSCADNQCVDCTQSADCGTEQPVCIDNTCQPCTLDDQCGVGLLCSSGVCVECESGADCAGETPICNDGACEPCQVGSCPSGVCNVDSGECEPCSQSNCAGYCDGATCSACSGDLCPDGRVCVSGECVSCSPRDAGVGAQCPATLECNVGVCE